MRLHDESGGDAATATVASAWIEPHGNETTLRNLALSQADGRDNLRSA